MTCIAKSLTIVLMAVALLGCDDSHSDQNLDPQGESDEHAAEQSSTDPDPATTEGPRETAEDIHHVRERMRRYGELSTFIMGMLVTNSMELLEDDDEYTVFVPGDEAFDAYRDDLEDIFEEHQHHRARDMLFMHIVPGRITADQFESGALETLGESTVQLSVDGDTLEYGSATIIDTDHRARNGVFHVIDDVVFPDDF